MAFLLIDAKFGVGVRTCAKRRRRRAPICARVVRLQHGREPRALVDRALRIEFGGDVGATDQMRRRRRLRRARRAARGSVPGRRRSRSCRPAAAALCRRRAMCRPRVVDAFVLDAAEHRTPFALARAMHPAGGLVEPLARTAGVRCSSHTSRRRGSGAGAHEAAARVERRVDAPFVRPARDIGASAMARDCTRNSATSKPMPPAPTIATRLPATRRAEQQIDIAHDVRMLDARESTRRAA